jgi:uncharacterized protein YukE
MAEKIRLNYAACEDMAKQCQAVQQRLQQTAQNAAKWGQTMQGGALMGPPGEAFVQALGIFSNKINKLANKFGEENEDINKAMNEMRQSDSSAGARF